MAYMNAERKAQRATEIKEICQRYGIKATLSVRNHSTLVLNIKSGAIDFIGNYKENQLGRVSAFVRENQTITSLDVNPYWYKEHFTGSALAFLTEVIAAMYGADYYDESDAQTDYFHCSHYIDVNVGRWDRPYQVTE